MPIARKPVRAFQMPFGEGHEGDVTVFVPDGCSFHDGSGLHEGVAGKSGRGKRAKVN